MPDFAKIAKMFGGTSSLSSHESTPKPAPKKRDEQDEPAQMPTLLRPLPKQTGPRMALPPDAPDSFERRILDFARGLMGGEQEPGQTASGLGALFGAALPVFGQLKALKTARSATAAVKAENAIQEGITAYHGSPHNYSAERLIKWPDGRTEYIVGTPDVLPTVPKGADVVKDFPLGRQRLDKIGTGEGAQAYGHGLYEAENPGVAEGYRNTLAESPEILHLKIGSKRVGEKAGGFDYSPKGNTAYENINSSLIEDLLIDQNTLVGMPPEQLQAHVLKVLDGKIAAFAKEWPEGVGPARQLRIDLQKPGAVALKVSERPGATYQVKINASPDDFLDWDKPLSEQSAKVGPILDRTYKPDYRIEPSGDGGFTVLNKGTKYGTYNKLEDAEKRAASLYESAMQRYKEPSTVGDAMQTVQDRAGLSAELKKAGIPGIKYLDGNSRTAGEGSRNYVLFDDALVTILKKYGVALPAIGLLQQLAKQNNGAVPESMIAPLLTKKKDHK